MAAVIDIGRFFTSLRLHNFMRIFLIVGILSLCTSIIYGQKENTFAPEFAELDYSNPTKYNIGGINVIGAEARDDNAIKSITGLREGNSITIPGQELTGGIKKLWNLGLFSDVTLVLDSIVGEEIFLTIQLQEQPILTRIVFTDMNKTKTDKLTEELENKPRIGGIVTDNDRKKASNKIKQYYIEKGHLDAVVKTREIKDTTKTNSVVLVFDIEKKDRVKIDKISFIGNEAVKSKKLRKLLKGTKQKNVLLKKSKYVVTDYKEDKKSLLSHYAKLGYSDAEIISDSVYRDEKGLVNIDIVINEGLEYKYGDITWKGNTIYTDQQLTQVLGIRKGEVFNPEELSKRLEFSLDGRDISSLYMDNGYLFFNIDPQTVAIYKDTLNLEMRIYEGPQATIDRVVIEGNDRTHESVVRRVVRTKPGEKFSRSQIVRSQREITNLGYFDPENLTMDTPVNYERGTVDIIYKVVETPSDQLELSAGYGGFQGLIGTLGVTFNNFSVQNIRNKAAWSPLPTGDGQRVSLRLQSNSRFFRSFNVSFTEPWLGGHKPNAFTVGAATTTFDQSSFQLGKLDIRRFFIGLGTSLSFPDDYFVSNTTLNIENITLEDYNSQFLVNNGNYKNFNINQTISRSSISNPMFPMNGSRVSLSLQFTPPYSLFRGDDFWRIEEGSPERTNLVNAELQTLGIRQREAFTTEQDATGRTAADYFIEDIETGRRFEWLEYHKWRFDAEWFFNPVGKLVIMAQAKMGYLGNFSDEIGDVPFERFQLGGDGLSNQNNGIQGTDIIALRGYEEEDIDPNYRSSGGGTIFNKFTAEIRYPLSTNPNSTIYTALFFQAGNQWNQFRDYNPFELRRTVGAGIRVFLPMFGLLGFDYGFGLDKVVDGDNNPRFGQLGKFSIVLGFEPD
ncbi:MAG: outer membrane protein insertion porin family [Saprospiraceae bacterium]